MAKVEIKDGVVYLEGKPFYLSSADYPYFRDEAENWDDRLEKLKNCGLKVITCYFPWRHHELVIDGKRRFDFVGETQDNRNVIRFLQLCQEKRLLVIAKPGPFIHAETNYGGLPDFVCPLSNSKIEAMLNHRGEPVTWPGSECSEDGRSAKPWPLPAPLDPVFLKEVEHWLGAVREEIITPLSYPEGPIFLVQLGNEGIYSNAQRPPWEYDYSNSSLQYFRQCLREDYKSISKYNRLHGTTYSAWQEIEPVREWKQPGKMEDLLAYMDWSSYQWKYMREIYRLYSSFLPTELPYVVNLNPPVAEPFGIDAWLSRVNPDEWPDVHYGFTNWIGVASEDPSVLERYLVLAKRSRGANLEENWGLTRPYGHPYRFATVCYFQTLLAIAAGATGYNAYTGVGTSLWNDHLDRFQEKPYPSHAPIDDSGEVTPKAQIMSFLNEFLENYGSEFLETEPPKPIAWGVYLPYAYIGAWVSGGEKHISQEDTGLLITQECTFDREVRASESDESDREGWTTGSFTIPKCGPALQNFQRQLLSLNIDYGIENLQTAPLDALTKYPFLILQGEFFMDRETQEKLCAYMDGGGKLIIIEELPHLDEEFRKCTILKQREEEILVVPEELFCGGNFGDFLIELGLQRPLVAEGAKQVWLYEHPGKDVQYLFILARNEGTGVTNISYDGPGGSKKVKVQIAVGSGAILRIEGARISAALLKGVNDFKENYVSSFCQVNDSEISADIPCDLLVIQKGDSYKVKVANATEGEVRVQFPDREG